LYYIPLQHLIEVVLLITLLFQSKESSPIGFFGFFVLNAIFSYIMATSFSGGRSRSTRREPLTMVKELVNFITCG
jgi:hypothetical protein